MIASWGKPGVERLAMEADLASARISQTIKPDAHAEEAEPSNDAGYIDWPADGNQRNQNHCLPACSHCGELIPITESCYSDACGGVFHRACAQILMAQRALDRPGYVTYTPAIECHFWEGLVIGALSGVFLSAGVVAGFLAHLWASG